MIGCLHIEQIAGGKQALHAAVFSALQVINTDVQRPASLFGQVACHMAGTRRNTVNTGKFQSFV